MAGRLPIPIGEVFVSPSGCPRWIDHKALVLELEPRAVMEHTGQRGYEYAVYEYDQALCGVTEDTDPEMLGSGFTEAAAWRDAHLTITEPEECTCPRPIPLTP